MKILPLYFFTAFFLAGVSHAAEKTNRAGIYSSLRYVDESGDLLGMELLLVPEGTSGEKYAAVVQLAEGGLPEIVLSHIEVKIKSLTLLSN